MKKSRIILPALGVLILSSAAAVTGTVAWFTASRIANVAMSGISAVNPEQGLILDYAKDGGNTTINVTPAGDYNASTGVVSNNATVAVVHNQLRDASVDVSADKVFGTVLADDGAIASIEEKTITTADSKKYNNNNVYYATKFTLGFKINRVESGYSQSLLFDQGVSSVTAPATVDADHDIKGALRIGFKTASDWFVWAPFTSDTVGTTEGESLRYVSVAGTGEGTQSFYGTDEIILGSATASTTAYTTDSSVTTAAAVQAYAGYLGKLTGTDLMVTIYTWFEGTDSVCDNQATALASAFTANLQFTMRKSVTY